MWRHAKVFVAFWALVFGLETIFNMIPESDSAEAFVERAVVALIIAGGLTFFWFQFRPARPPSNN